MTAHTDVLKQCLQNLASAAQAALERCLDHVVADLQLLETRSMVVPERDALGNNWRYLTRHKTEWCERYAVDLADEFTRGRSTKPSPAHATQVGFGRAGLESAGLVDDAELNQALNAKRLLQEVLPIVEQTLAELDALISSALGLGHVVPDRNPIRPQVLTGALHDLLTATIEDQASTSESLKHLAKPLGRELQKLYADAINTLKLANIASASYLYRVQSSGPKTDIDQPLKSSIQATGHLGNSIQEEQEKNSGQPVQHADLTDQGVKTALLKDFLENRSGVADQRLSALYYDNVEQELAGLKAIPVSRATLFTQAAQACLANTPSIDRPQRAINASTSLSEQVWGPYGTSRARDMLRHQLKKEATQVSQALGLDVVRQLVNQVAQDPRLLAPVREAIVALEPSLLRLALVDPRFFSDERHPGRQLMERVAQRSFKYNDEFSPEFATFFEAIGSSFSQLNARTVEDIQPFSAALENLQQSWDLQDEHEFDKRQKVLQTLRFAEERQNTANQIAFDLSNRSDLEKVPGKVLDFLFGPWALAMAHARLIDTRNQIDPEGYGSVVPDLVWSVKHEVTLKQPAKLIDMIPGLLDKLHSGLGLLGQDPAENDAFFESLMKLHRPVLKLRRAKSQHDAGLSGAAPLESDMAFVSPSERLEKLRVHVDAPLWMGRTDLDVAGFEDTQPTAPAELGEDQPMSEMMEDVDAKTGTQSESENAANATKKPPRQYEPLPARQFDQDTQDTKREASRVLQRLRTGHWVDLYSKRQWLRAQLVWASSKATLFMFISHGGQPHSMTQRSCEKLIAQRLLRPVDTHGVVAYALDAVALEVATQCLPNESLIEKSSQLGEFETV